MKLRQAKKIFRREYLSIPYYKNVKASNRLLKAIKIYDILGEKSIGQ